MIPWSESSCEPIVNDDCFNVGMSGKCGVECHVFVKGGCENSGEFSPTDLLKVYDEETVQEIMEYYPILLAKQDKENQQ